jgi:hypothetical protein
MAAPRKKLFKRSRLPKQGERDQSLDDLKGQLSDIQSKISEMEGEEEEELEEETLYHWSSPSHVFIPRGKKWLTYVVLITLLIILVLLFIREFFIIAPVLAVAFLAYVLASVPPTEIEHRFTSQGVVSGKHDYLWEELYDFWFTEKHGHTVLNIDSQIQFPGRIMLVIPEKDKEKIKNILIRYLPFREIPKTSWLDNFGDSLSNIFHKMAG